jgi:hypothetical protein
MGVSGWCEGECGSGAAAEAGEFNIEFAESTEGKERKEERGGRHIGLLRQGEKPGEDEIRLRAQGGSIYVVLPRSMEAL